MNVYLADVKGRWEEYCRGLGKSPGAAIKELVDARLREAAKPRAVEVAVPVSSQVENAPDAGMRTRVEVRLTTSERARLGALAAREGCSIQQWIVNTVRATLTHQPQFGMRELQALGESNYQLLAIGRNLNQVAKRMNEGLPERLTLQELRALREQIREHTDRAATAMRASVERWRVQ